MNVMHLKNNIAGRVLLSLGISVVLLYGCSTAVEQPQGNQPPSRLQPAVSPGVSINALMVAWIDHSGHALWDVEQEGRAPKTDADWREVERHATQLVASGTLIALGGTGPADPGWAQSPDWQRYSQELTNAGAAALNATRTRNFEALVTANGQLVEVCENCHKEFKPEVPTEGKTHQPD